MNILPKKRWHVRTKDNIARVRKDEAEAAEKERQEKLRIENAERESRLNILKQKSKEKLQNSGIETPTISAEADTHINFFSDLEHTTKVYNKDHNKEQKEEKEQYEKQIGYLTYLGQDTNEALGKKNWYEVLPESSRFSRSDEIRDTYNKLVLKDKDGLPLPDKIEDEDETDIKIKKRLDPLNNFKEYCFNYGKKRKTDKHDKKLITHKNEKKHEKKDKMQMLREARLKREEAEKRKAEMLLAGLNSVSTVRSEKTKDLHKVKPKYNSQFNPELARQNYR